MEMIGKVRILVLVRFYIGAVPNQCCHCWPGRGGGHLFFLSKRGLEITMIGTLPMLMKMYL